MPERLYRELSPSATVAAARPAELAHHFGQIPRRTGAARQTQPHWTRPIGRPLTTSKCYLRRRIYGFRWAIRARIFCLMVSASTASHSISMGEAGSRGMEQGTGKSDTRVLRATHCRRRSSGVWLRVTATGHHHEELAFRPTPQAGRRDHARFRNSAAGHVRGWNCHAGRRADGSARCTRPASIDRAASAG